LAPSALEGMTTGAAKNVAAVDLRNCRREIWFNFIKDLSIGKSFLRPARFIGKGEDDDCVRRALRDLIQPPLSLIGGRKFTFRTCTGPMAVSNLMIQPSNHPVREGVKQTWPPGSLERNASPPP